MNPVLANEPVSSNCSAFCDLLDRTFETGELAILLFRYANCGGAKDYFIARSAVEFATAMKHARPKTSVTVFFQTNFKIKGIANDQLCDETVTLLPSVRSHYEGVDLIRLDGPNCDLDDRYFMCAADVNEICQWFMENKGMPVVAGTLEFWHHNCESMVTVYVPDDDGVVRPGAY